ncbi:AroM family protein [Paraburkholderia phenoliruptrix]|uniref:Asp/Glu/hydantoin racemase n=2 Tax=Paraburkholderia phenoliruptrix TaxID=252970 RepID=K0DZU0_9BURK|nr:AroM family protein [Paraburkholderia phenoliruptrix]AFT90455.1 Asp/Glu/hydantoin racemase [Paraburkholderia phenoliruptrix BR3459a]CAB4051865.1 hypothetical protein LMG9964_05545 [Paraburkholderia phenoliruptrix]
MKDNDAEQWTKVPVAVRDSRRTRIGLIALDIDDVVESDLREFLRGTSAEVVTTRIMTARGTCESRRILETEISRAAQSLLPTSDIEAIVFGCTSAAVKMGSSRISAILHRERPNVMVVDPASACLSVLDSIGAQSVGLITPYSSDTSELTASHFENASINVRSRVRFDIDSGRPEQPSLDEFRQACAIVCAGRRLDCIFISCMGLRTNHIYRELALEFDLPVLTSTYVVARTLMDTVLRSKSSWEPAQCNHKNAT